MNLPRVALFPLTLLFAMTAPALLPAQKPTPNCSSCAKWNTPQEPFRIYGNTYYVGPHGISSILITSPQGHILIDGAISESAPQIAAHIRSLGFRVEDVKLILSTHIHFDHAGGIAELQRMTGATVMASSSSAKVLSTGKNDPADPQFEILLPLDKVANVKVLSPGETVHVGPLAVTSHPTPGHTPGGTSWTWTSCEGDRCHSMVYADSVSAVSADDYKFTHNATNPHAIQDFDKSFAFLETVPCDVLLTAHPEVSDLWDKLERRKAGVTPDPMVDPGACKQLAADARHQLDLRIAKENGK
jgi:metallo-beta-lactamase class B